MEPCSSKEELESVNRVAITGLGIICGAGRDLSECWENIRNGNPCFREVDIFPVDEYPCKRASFVDESILKLSPYAKWKFLSRNEMLAMIAVEEAIKDSGIILDNIPEERRSVIMGAGAGGISTTERYFKDLFTTGKSRKVYRLWPYPPGTVADLVAGEYRLLGPRISLSTACSSSAIAIAAAYLLIKRGEVDMAIAGGSEPITELTFSGFQSLQAMAPDLCRPFDLNRKGMMLGEGAAFLILESMDSALSRNATILAEILGFGVSSDAYHMAAPHPEGKGAAFAMRRALDMAGLDPVDIDYLNAHGTGTKLNDIAETIAIKRVFGDYAYKLPISSTKSVTGHCLGAAGAIEAVASVLAITNGEIPPTASYNEKDPECDLDYVPNCYKKAPIRKVMTNSFAFGGNNVTLIFGKM